MVKEINIVYYAVNTKTLEFENSNGKVWMSNQRDLAMINVFLGDSIDPQPKDSVIIAEPIVTTPSHYDMQYLSQFKKIIGWANRFFEKSQIQDKFVGINCGSESMPQDADQLRENWLPWEQRKNAVLIISSGNKNSKHPDSIYNLRVLLADFFYENNYEVDWYGYASPHRPYYRGPIQNKDKNFTYKHKIQKIHQYKFHICTENTYSPIFSYNYLTEKLPHAIYGGAVPLYMGCYNIEELLPKETFFDLRNFVIKRNNEIVLLKQPLLEAIKSFSAIDFEKYNKASYNVIKDPNGIFYLTDTNRGCKKLLEIL